MLINCETLSLKYRLFITRSSALPRAPTSNGVSPARAPSCCSLAFNSICRARGRNAIRVIEATRIVLFTLLKVTYFHAMYRLSIKRFA
jgi:hypothetical protein